MDKKVVVIIRKPPHGSYLPAEALRAATALTLYDMDIKVVALDDGVYVFLEEADKRLYNEHLQFLIDSGARILVDEDSLKERGLENKHIVEGVEITPHNEIIKTITESNAVLVF